MLRSPFLAWLVLLLLPMAAAAQDGIHRCIGPDGNPLFTDQPCAALQATPVAPARATAPVTTPPGASMPLVETPAPVLCATSVAELRQSVLDAFASRNPNRLAGLMLWGGHGRDAVVADIRSMSTLMQQPLLDVGASSDEPQPAEAATSGDAANPDQPLAAGNAPPAAPRPPAGDREIVVRTAAGDGSGVPRETRFSVVRRAGCLWLHGGN
ncbi:DUF4124 domain-containing protein [Dyella soli]|uniref:DUF4124 domain-containing protein n=1 Tax=Dyella soli TaxID=522319 RepID=A0A4R0YQH6_9GAMM|nr:DUF4124 domain-containing protein [Dyella soli]TCI07081.1 DUF4124 domain-containing protein [Dyella soli]